MSSWFENVEGAAPIEIFLLNKLHKEDTFPQKIDLGIGAYRDNNAKPWVLPVVRKAEKLIANDDSLNHEYLPILGMEDFSDLATRMVLGEDSLPLKEGRVISAQSLSGTGALRVLADFLRLCFQADTVYISSPSWPNHQLLFKHANYTNVNSYRYWNAQTKSLDLNGMLEDLEKAKKGSVVILHACAHNPTGVDPTEEQWKQIADTIERKQLFTLFDCAYQGFASGDLDKDAYSIRYFISRGMELAVAQSFAKNFGLYNERIGNLLFVVKDKKHLPNIRAQLSTIVRANYSNPPAHGARIVKTVLSNPELNAEWRENIKTMSSRIIQMRAALRAKLEELGAPGDWSHITNQIGMFSYTGLNENQCKHLVEKYHIYLTKSGRISCCGVNSSNIDYLAKAITETVKSIN